jgi:hypothetical protein
VEALVVSATLVGSLGTAWAIQRAILAFLLKALETNRR